MAIRIRAGGEPAARARYRRSGRRARRDRRRSRGRRRRRRSAPPRFTFRVRSASGRRRHVVDPVAERERARARGRGAVEDDVVRAGRGQDRAGGEHELAERAQIRIEVERQRRVAGQAALVAGAHDPRLDADARRPARDDDAEVRRGPGERDPEDALGPGRRGAEAEPDRALRIAVAGDAATCRPSSWPCSRRRCRSATASRPRAPGVPVPNQYGIRSRSVPRVSTT